MASFRPFFQFCRTFYRHFEANSQHYAGFGMTGVITALAYPQTFGLSRYQSILANYTSTGEAEKLSEALNTLTDKVLFDILLRPEEEANIKLFVAFGHDMVHKGSCKIRTGSILGIPSTFNFTSLEDVAKQQFMLNLQPVDWTSSSGQLLMSSLLLSENAKKFAIAREIYYVNTNPVWTTGGLQFVCSSLAYTAGFAMSRLYDFKLRVKRWGRVGFYSIIGAIGFAAYLQVLDLYTCSRDRKADKQAALLGLDYAAGGVEYYNQLLQRNKALYLLLGPTGSSLYTPYGNEKSTYRRSHLQISERRDNLVKLHQDIQDNPSLLDKPYKREYEDSPMQRAMTPRGAKTKDTS